MSSGSTTLTWLATKSGGAREEAGVERAEEGGNEYEGEVSCSRQLLIRRAGDLLGLVS